VTNQSRRILIADDHALVREGMRTILQSQEGWMVCAEATTGREALARALELKPDLVILDLALPEMNGVEVTRQIRAAMPVPILIVTMLDEDQVVQEAIDAGANGYLLKADAGRTLPEAVHAIFSRGTFLSDGVRAAAGIEPAERQPTEERKRSGRLTAREREVLQLLAEGLANKQIATTLGITTKTAETHRARIMAKLELHSISELVRYAIRNRIIKP
jgi:DNA-binding NarL/FixJ family response regulator